MKPTSFAALALSGDMEKGAFLRNAVDSAWNATVKPMANAAGRVAQGVGRSVGGGVRGFFNGATLVPRAGLAALGGAFQNDGTLGGAVQNMWDSGMGSLKNSLATRGRSMGDFYHGMRTAVPASLDWSKRLFLAAPTAGTAALSGALTGNTYQGPQSAPAPVWAPAAAPAPQMAAASFTQSPQAYDAWRQKNASAFASLEKEAMALRLGQGLSSAGKRLRGHGKPDNFIHGLGSRLLGAGQKIRRSPQLAKRIDYGTGAVAGGAGLWGAHGYGKQKGLTEGVERGYDTGVDHGIRGARALTADDNFMTRLLDLFRGRQQPDPNDIRGLLNQDRERVLQSLIAG